VEQEYTFVEDPEDCRTPAEKARHERRQGAMMDRRIAFMGPAQKKEEVVEPSLAEKKALEDLAVILERRKAKGVGVDTSSW
jgi:hypothetical protein